MHIHVGMQLNKKVVHFWTHSSELLQELTTGKVYELEYFYSTWKFLIGGYWKIILNFLRALREAQSHSGPTQPSTLY